MQTDKALDAKVDPEMRERLFPLDRPYELTIDPGYTVLQGEPRDDLALVDRITTAYKKAQVFVEDAQSFWSDHFGGRKKPVHDALMAGDVATVASMLRDPAGNDLFYGFDHPCVTWWGPISVDVDGWHARGLYDRLVRLAEGIGALRCYHPETPLSHQAGPRPLEEIFAAIDGAAGTRIEFPTPYLREAGVVTERGLITYRPIQSLFQAFLLRDTLDSPGTSKVVEIGAGLGRTAYYAITLGLRNYTIVDLPMTSVAQAYFLGRTLGPDRIRLFGEQHDASVSIIPPDTFYTSQDRYDVCLNVDSLTELSRDSADKYIDLISKATPLMISINHEANTFTTRDLYKDRPEWKVSRSPYWLRKGYTQEMIRFGKAEPTQARPRSWWPFRR
jgi:hypothetical protein